MLPIGHKKSLLLFCVLMLLSFLFKKKGLGNYMLCPHLKYCMKYWSPYLEKDVVELDKVQRRAIKMNRGLEQLPYQNRLRRERLQFAREKAEQGCGRGL